MDPFELGRHVSKLRKDKDWSQEELSKIADISRNYVSQIERGEARNVSIKVINKLALALGVSPSELTQITIDLTLMIPPALREFALEENLSYEIADRLVNIPRRGKEPSTVAEWRTLYEAVRPYISSEKMLDHD